MGGRPYIVIAENTAERSHDRSHPMERLSHSRHGRLAMWLLLICGGTRFEGLIGTKNIRFVARKGRGVYIVRRNGQRQ